MKAELEKKFNPFYDSTFYISLEDEPTLGSRMLIELDDEELIRLRNEIDYILNTLHSQATKEQTCLKTKIYSVFPACGKTWLYKHQKDYGLKILDSDSSKFSWICTNKDEDGNAIRGMRRVRNPDFPTNYIEHIKENIGKYDCIFVSSHASVREALDKEGIDFTIVYPEASCKAEWVGRCFIRDKNCETGCGAEAIYNNWDQWISECETTGTNHEEIVLQPRENLSDYFH